MWIAIGSAGAYVIICYLPTGAAASPLLAESMDVLFTIVAFWGPKPVVALGDFQSPASLYSFVLLSDEWFHVHHEQQTGLGKTVETGNPG